MISIFFPDRSLPVPLAGILRSPRPRWSVTRRRTRPKVSVSSVSRSRETSLRPCERWTGNTLGQGPLRLGSLQNKNFTRKRDDLGTAYRGDHKEWVKGGCGLPNIWNSKKKYIFHKRLKNSVVTGVLREYVVFSRRAVTDLPSMKIYEFLPTCPP